MLSLALNYVSPGQALRRVMSSIQSDDCRLSMSKPMQDFFYSASKFTRLGLAKKTLKAYDSALDFFSSFCANLILCLYQ